MTTLEPCTLRALLGRADLAMRLETDEPLLPPDRLDRPVRWTHSSDLPDPTPFLAPGIVLLTTGAQLTDDDATRAYVRRLAAVDVAGIGFGSGVVHDAVPEVLRQACVDEAVPLLDVPYDTPFIAVSRATADLVAAHAYERRTWELNAYRALASAGLRPDPLGALLAELAEQIGAWVGLCDSSGRLTRQHPERLRPARAEELGQRVRERIDRGARAAAVVPVGNRWFGVWTFGRTSRARGALVIDAPALDAESRGLVRTIVAMLGIAGESEEVTARAYRRLSRAVLAALLAGEPKMARQMARHAWGGLPKAPVRVAVTAPGPHVDALRSFLDVHGDPSRTFLGETHDEVVLVCQDVATVADLAARCRGRFGVSLPTRYDRFAEALGHARLALDRGHGPVTAVDDVTTGGVLAALGPEARMAARATLEPLLHHDRERGTALVATLRAWLEHGTEHGATARALGVHRHTVRSRIASVQRVLDRDLTTFAVQAELWASLSALDQETT